MSAQPFSSAQRLAFSPRELASLTGLGLSTVYRRLATGEIRSNRSGRPGRRVLIPRQELERLLMPDAASTSPACKAIGAGA
jgi:excisionase family DNA binding protein